MRFRRRARDLTIEVLIAVVLVTAYVIYLFKFPEGHRPDSRIIGLSVNTSRPSTRRRVLGLQLDDNATNQA